VTPEWALRPAPTGTGTRSPSADRKSGCLLPRSPEAVLELEAELDGPSGFAVDTSTCPAGNADDCTYGRQETLHFRPKKAGTYTIRVYPAADGDGSGGSFSDERTVRGFQRARERR
jgi:hypothetical protein